jgi:ABC-type multidrug transport system fused ATPase/permease subunit
VSKKRQPVAVADRLGVVIGGLKLLNRPERLGALGLVALMMLAGMLESGVVALVVPLVYVIVDPAKFNATQAGQAIVAWTGYPVEQMFPFLAAGLAVLLVVSAVISGVATYLSEVHSVRCRNRVSRELIERVIDAPYLWIIKRNPVVTMRHIFEDVRAWRRDFIQALLMSTQAVIMIVAPAAVVIAIAPARGVAALALVALVCALVVFAFRRKIRILSAQLLVAQDSHNRTLLQLLAGIREVKVSGHGQYFVGLIKRCQLSLENLVVMSRVWSGAPASIILLLGQLGFIGTAAFLWSQSLTGAEFAAQIALIAVVVSRVVPAFNRLAAQVTSMFRAAPMVESLIAFRAEINQANASSLHSASGSDVPADWRRLSLADVSFRYPKAGSWSLQDATIELERGKSYGFVGRSGAGKTTLVNLLLGLIEPTRGAVCVDGRPLPEFRLSSWHRKFGYVPQDAFLFDDSLRENIRFGSNGSDEVRLRAAIDAAQLGSLVDRLATGLDSRVGERGREISGGQSQRVAIARALYRRPEILFLDEATSALDSVTEAAIYDAIEAMRGESLALIVAHRVSTLRRCDRIFVLERGRIVESGTYQELLARSELFRALAAQSEQPVQASA